MKRFLISVIAAVCTVVIYAGGGISQKATPRIEPLNPAALTSTIDLQSLQCPAASSKMQKSKGIAKVKQLNTIEDYYGLYAWYKLVGLQGHDGYEKSSIEIAPSDIPGHVNIYGIYSNYPIDAEIDANKGTITIKRQFICYNSYYYCDVFVQPYMNVATAYESTQIEPCDKFEIKYCPDGIDVNGEHDYDGWLLNTRATADETYLLGIQAEQDGSKLGYFNLAFQNHFAPLDTYFECAGCRMNKSFEFSQNEWKYCGKASINDGWIAPIFELSNFDKYSVLCYRNIYNPDEVLLMNPFGEDTPFAELNDRPTQGYIILNIANPNCILAMPFIRSGFNHESFRGEIFAFNYEGMEYYFYDKSYEDIEEAIYHEGMYNSTMDENGAITLNNLRVALMDNIFEGYSNDSEDGTFIAKSIIQLPDDAYAPMEPTEYPPTIAKPETINIFDIESNPGEWYTNYGYLGKGYKGTTKDGNYTVNITTYKNNSTTDLLAPNFNTYAWRVYQGSSFCISVPEMEITELKITFDDYNDIYYGELELSEGWAGMLDGNVYTVTSPGLTEFTATAAEKQVRIKRIDAVIYPEGSIHEGDPEIPTEPVDPDDNTVPLKISIADIYSVTINTVKVRPATIAFDLDKYWEIESIRFNDEELSVEAGKTEYTTPAITEPSELTAELRFAGDIYTVEPSGVTTIEELGINVKMDNNQVMISGLNPSDSIAVYSIDGKVIARPEVTGETLAISLMSGMSYVVRINDAAIKIIL